MMARRKETLWQRDFSLGAVRPEAQERDDTDLIERSLKVAKNTVTLTSGQIKERPGLLHISTTNGRQGWHVSLGAFRVFDVIPTPAGVDVFYFDELFYENNSINWETVSGAYLNEPFEEMKFWVVADVERRTIFIGSQNVPIHALVLSTSGTFTFGRVQFDEFSNGVPAVPFFRHQKDVRIRCYGFDGSVTLESDIPYFSPNMVGLYFEYEGGYFEITGYSNGRQVSANMAKTFNRTIRFNLTVAADAADFNVGDAVEHKEGGGTGFVAARSGTQIDIVCTNNYKLFSNTGTLLGPNAQATIAGPGRISVSPSAYSPRWSLEMMNARWGYAGTAAIHRGRLYLSDFVFDSLVFAASVAGVTTSFEAGVEDDDGFVDRIASSQGGKIQYMLSAGDLLFMTTEGLYYQQSRDGSIISPTTINPIFFSPIGVGVVEPAIIEDGVVFVDRSLRQLHACVLSGDVYRSWTTTPLTEMHTHLFSETVHLGATYRGSGAAEDFVYATQADGSLCVGQWNRASGAISWRPWETQGKFVCVFQGFRGTLALVDRETISGTLRRVEVMCEGLYLDSAGLMTKSNPGLSWGARGGEIDGHTSGGIGHLAREIPSVYFEGWVIEGYEVDFPFGSLNVMFKDGENLEVNGPAGVIQVGYPFEIECQPWARRSVNSQRGTRDIKRLIDLTFTVQKTGIFELNGQEFGGYQAGDNLTLPPPMRSDDYRFAHFGGQHAEVNAIKKTKPGPFLLTRIGYRVTV